jgi:hypothetical protein
MDMSVYMFCYGQGKVSQREGLAIHRIAKEHGAEFTHADMPEGPRFWFTAPNNGAPFDDALKASVIGALMAKGLCDANGMLVLRSRRAGRD